MIDRFVLRMTKSLRSLEMVIIKNWKTANMPLSGNIFGIINSILLPTDFNYDVLVNS